MEFAELRGAINAAYVYCAGLFHVVHICVWLCGGAEQAGRAGIGAVAGHFAIDSSVRVLVDHSDGVHCVIQGQPAGVGGGFDIRHFHGAGLEHDILALPIAAIGTTGTG